MLITESQKFNQHDSIKEIPKDQIRIKIKKNTLIENKSRNSAYSHLRRSLEISETAYLSHNNSKSKNIDEPLKNQQKKWQKTVELYKMTNRFHRNSNCQLEPGMSFYKCLLTHIKQQQNQWKFKVPQTIALDNQGNACLLYTNQNGYLAYKVLQGNNHHQELENAYRKFISQLIHHKKYKKQLDLQLNDNTLIIINKICQNEYNNNKFETEVQNYQNYHDRRSKPTNNKIIQRYIYSRNMKSMIIRYYYHKPTLKQPQGRIYAYKFQNKNNIFQCNSKNHLLLQSNKLTSTIFLSEKRINTLQYYKITNKQGLIKFIQPSHQLMKFLQQNNRINISVLYIDYMMDLLDNLWVINIKHIEVNDQIILTKTIDNENCILATGQCRLCTSFYPKVQLKNIISIRMLCEFTQHLKQRIRLEDHNNNNFIKEVSINCKQNKSCAVCICCYSLIIQELQLMECEKKFANYCRIQMKQEQINNNDCISKFSSHLKQWRLLIYMQSIKGLKSQHLNENPIYLYYSLGAGLKVKWKCQNLSNKNTTLNQLKVHYFFSQDMDIQNFIKNTQIIIYLSQNDTHHTFAKGSTKIISNFKRKFPMDSGQRQTSTILLFFQDKDYCELVLKVGLVYDGTYPIPQINFKKINQVYFAEKNYLNCNPMPRQWIEAFNINLNEQEEKSQNWLKKQLGLQRRPLIRQ